MTLLEGFATYKPRVLTERERIVGMPPGTRCMRLERMMHGWRVWLATLDFVYGTYLELLDTGEVYRITARDNEGDDVMTIRPDDDTIRELKP